MTQLQKVTLDFNNNLIDVKYKYAIELLKLLSDEDYTLLCEDNPKLMEPILQPGGDEYLKNDLVLDELITLFIKYIEDAEPDPNKMNVDELKQYIQACLEKIDEESLRDIANTLHATVRYLD